jgi:hypothetical protein
LLMRSLRPYYYRNICGNFNFSIADSDVIAGLIILNLQPKY